VCIYFSLRNVFKQVGSTKCSLTDAQMIRKRRMSQDYFAISLLMHAYRVEHFGVAKKQKSRLSSFFLGLPWDKFFSCFYYYFACPHSVSSSYLIVYRFNQCCFFGVLYLLHVFFLQLLL